MSADNSQSAEKREVMGKTREQTGSPSRELEIPLLHLPCTFDAEGKLVVESLADKCRLCEWDGTPGNLFLTEIQAADRYYRVTRAELQETESRCLCCKIRLLFLQEMTRYEGATPEPGDILGFSTKYSGRVSHTGFYLGIPYDEGSFHSYDIFMPRDSSLPEIDGAFTLSRRRTTWDDASPEDSMDQSIIWAREHISDCLHSHKQCAIHADGLVVPTRLIDVDPAGDGKNTDVKLQDFSSATPGTLIEYAALSYCWGSYKPECMTTPETLNRNLCRIPSNLLPQTFRDAVRVTRGLGLKYLWIDSICIIQGDKNDWCREAGRMFDVYRGSKITLAAVFGEDSRSGLRVTTPKQQTHIVANLSLGQFTYPLYFRHHHYLWCPTTGWETHKLNSNIPLLKRAWTYQERIISPRVIFFTESEIVFQCTCEVKCECGSATDSWKNRDEDDYDKMRIHLATQPKSNDKKTEPTQSFGSNKSSSTNKDDEDSIKTKQTWRRFVVQDYSALDLTDQRDKLAALGAIAKQFQRALPASQYLAGLWSDSLLDDLLWLTDGLLPCFQPGRPLNLPTWSWASLREGAYHSFPLDEGRYHAKVVEATCIYANDNNFGVLESSTLILRGPMLSCALCEDGNLYGVSSLGVEAQECLSPYVVWDCDRPGHPEIQELYLLHIRDFGYKGIGACACGLVLNLEDRNADPRIFSRQGLFFDRPRPSAEGKEYYPIERAFEKRGTLEEVEIR